ncbi:hypothetical protein KAT24_02805, partial [Candidatus Pacearchaeota archaeon]|nr:hypothetical protein [Candidatus Pacearchaeota archaeon]
RFASCSNARVEEVLSCWVEPEVCEPNCDGRVCGDDGCLPYDETDCGTCTGVGEVCDADGQCVVCTPDCSCALTICVDETCLEYDCNTYCEGVIEPDCTGLVCGPALNGCGNETVCGPCDGTCVDGVCLVSSCNGEWEGAGEDPGVECDGTPTPANCVDCICNSGYIPDENGGCEPYIPGSVVNCADWCAYIGNREGGGYTTGICKQTPSKCDDVSGGAWVNIDEFDVDGLGDTGDHVSCGVSGVDDECDGDEYCTAGAQANTCCCEP